jgi:HKD family nuclease
METSLLDATQVGNKLKELTNNHKELYWAVAWGSDSPLAKLLFESTKKIRAFLIGIDFYQTDPELLKRLSATKNARVALGMTNSTFHPKIYYFQSGKNAAAIVGSANFTKAGTSTNIEAALLLEGLAAEKPLLDIRILIESLWSKGSAIDNTFLTSYGLQHAANRRHREALSKPVRINRATLNATQPNLLTMSWKEYVAAVKNSPYHGLDKRLRMLNKAQSLLNGVDETFSDLKLEERKAIAGVIGRNETFGTEIDNYDWGWFGSMFGAGSFKNRINENDLHLSAALDHIPRAGEVSHDDYCSFINEFLLAFKNAAKQGNVPTASRLLAMKRPDVFPCVDSRNIKKMSADLGFAYSTLNFEKYWTEIVEPITTAKWWQSRRQRGVDGRIWDYRAAMLDAIYYEPKE